MQAQAAPRNRFILPGLALGLFVWVASALSLQAQIVTNGALIVTSGAVMSGGLAFARLSSQDATTRISGSDSMFTEVRLDLPDDFGVVLEDSVELFRGDMQQRPSAMDQAVREPKVSSKTVPIRHPKTAPPLLV
jgi:hypothetical protein